MSRFWIIPALLVVCVVVPFAIWGDVLTSILKIDQQTGTFQSTSWPAGLVGIALLVSDLVLPVPTTSVIAALGIVYGPLVGTLWAVAGSVLAATIGYAMGRFCGRPLALRWLGPDLLQGERLFDRHGGWIVAASRWMPILPEVVSVVAGVSHMRFAAFLLAAICGAIPHCAVFAVIGHLGAEAPLWTIVISALVPIGLWLLVSRSGLIERLGARSG